MNVPATVIAWVALAVSIIAGIFSYTASRGGGDQEAMISQQVAELAARVEAVKPFDASQIQKQVADLSSKLDAVKPFDPAPLQAKLDDIDKKLAAVPSAEPFDPAPLQAKLDDLDKKLAAMPAPEPFDPAPLQARIDEVGAKIAAMPAPFDAGPLKMQIEELSTKLAAATAADPAALQARVDEIARRIADIKPFDPTPLQAKIAALDAAVAEKTGGADIGKQRLLGQVYFDTNSSALTDEARATLDGWVKELEGKPHRLAILGFSDRVGRPDYNVNLSIRRAAAVRSYLLRSGLKQGAIVVSAGGYGEEGAPVATDDNVDEPQNRTVHVYVYE